MTPPSPNQVSARSAFVASHRRCATAGRILALHGRVGFRGGRLVITNHDQALTPPPPPGLDARQLRAQLRWLLTHDGHPAADGIETVLTALRAQLETRW
ncbi:MAG TPA: hypothetical protein VK501_14815 [Baekduia sp.]|uniref:hypothetical protein n=1 Tax=Baekduia sp. TaxID=2600305 RepID=UPI002BE27F3A|nr:hypothetical protein [Baekduia sp.]HMJ35180.1 hypothetical protein [Baekduia sp.]